MTALAVTDAQIDACGFRMFELDEIASTMSMHDHPAGGRYVVLGNKRERMAQYGNAVTPPATRFKLDRLAEVLGGGFTFTDLFCGAGGSSIGATLAGGELLLGLNHWRRAIETHAENFQDADHDCADVSALTTSQIRRYPDSDVLPRADDRDRRTHRPDRQEQHAARRRRPDGLPAARAVPDADRPLPPVARRPLPVRAAWPARARADDHDPRPARAHRPAVDERDAAHRDPSFVQVTETRPALLEVPRA